MMSLRTTLFTQLSSACTATTKCLVISPSRGLQNMILPPTYEGVQFPERNKLKFIEKVPQYPSGLRPPKMQKCLRFMRGPEPIHNEFIHKQFGIVAQGPGRMRYGHYEMIRLTIGRKMDADKMFAIWRIDPPWQPITKKGIGKRMGGGKGNIDHYVTPIKHGRVIVEVGGLCEFAQVKSWLSDVAHKLPFKAIAISHEQLQERLQNEKAKEDSDLNRFSYKYVIRNNMGKSHLWVSLADRKYFGKHA